MLDQHPPSQETYPGQHEDQVQESRAESNAEAQKTYNELQLQQAIDAENSNP
jgi:hypothetical protein